MGFGNITYPQATQDGQPQYGQPNNYSNTVGPWDNATIAPQQAVGKGGKSNYPVMPTSYGQPTGKGAASTQPTVLPNDQKNVSKSNDEDVYFDPSGSNVSGA